MLNDALLNIGANAMQAAAPYLAIHTALPDVTGSNQSTAPRLAANWPTAANGDFGVISLKSFVGGASLGPALYVGFWSTLTVGTGVFYGWLATVGDQAFNAAGAYNLTSLVIPGTAT